MTKTLLITYFGPFPGVSVNPSGVTARQVADVLGIDFDIAMLHKIQTLETVLLSEVK